MSALDITRSTTRRLAVSLRSRTRLIGVGVVAGATVLAAAVAAVAARRKGGDVVTLPDPATDATEKAVSLHNAAKGTIISAVRAADAPDRTLVVEVARRAVADAAEAGVDLVPVAIGVADGAVAIAHLLDVPQRELAISAAVAAVDVAMERGTTAGSRVRDSFAALPIP
jgi:hypothetical protein